MPILARTSACPTARWRSIAPRTASRARRKAKKNASASASIASPPCCSSVSRTTRSCCATTSSSSRGPPSRSVNRKVAVPAGDHAAAGRPAGRREGLVLLKDRALEPAQVLAGLEPELLVEQPAAGLVGGERVRL